MSLLRRDETGFSRARRARRLRDRARRQLGCSARFMIEELESRVLLSASSGPPAVTFFTLDLPVQTAAISALAEPSFPIRQLSTTEGEITHGISEAVSAGMNFVHLQLSTRPDPPMFILLEPPMPAGDQPASLALERGSAPPLHYGQLAPPLATEGTDFSIDFGATTTATAEPGHVSPASVPSNGTGWVNYASAANDPAPICQSFGRPEFARHRRSQASGSGWDAGPGPNDDDVRDSAGAANAVFGSECPPDRRRRRQRPCLGRWIWSIRPGPPWRNSARRRGPVRACSRA